MPGTDLASRRHEFSPTCDLKEAQTNYDYDRDRFLQFSSSVHLNSDATSLKAFLVEVEHAIEKGLAIESPRQAFGQKKILDVISAVHELEGTGHSDEATTAARACLQQYVNLHKTRNWSLPSGFESELQEFLAEKSTSDVGGTTPLARTDVERATNFDYERFVFSRHSVRHFTGEPVSRDAAKKAVRLALKTPRVCNREARHVYLALDPGLRSKLLSYHHGHSGFDKTLGAVFVITVDIRHYNKIGERNQGWVDGGLFAMSLCFALHSQGLGTCMMNWSEPCDQDQRLREAFAIPENEIVITFLGAGHLPSRIDVAYSVPPLVDDVLSDIQERH